MFFVPVIGNAQTSSDELKISTSSIISLANQDRNISGATALKNNTKLEKAAQLKAEDMARDQYFSHTSTDGKNPWYWLKQVGYRFKYAGENLAVLFTNPHDIENAWMNSKYHRENILSKNFTEIGIGIAKGTYKGEETQFIVELLGSE